MKKSIAFVLAALLLLSLTACGKDTAESQQITMATTVATEAATEETTAATQTETEATEASVTERAPFHFQWESVDLMPGQAYDATKMPEPESTYQVPSCAVEGTDNVYNFGAYEVTAFATSEGEFVYSIYLIDPNITTPEGLALGDSADKVAELYGADYTEEGTAMVYKAGETALYVIVENSTVTSIEYRNVK